MQILLHFIFFFFEILDSAPERNSALSVTRNPFNPLLEGLTLGFQFRVLSAQLKVAAPKTQTANHQQTEPYRDSQQQSAYRLAL
jgi:hypothetical protein